MTRKEFARRWLDATPPPAPAREDWDVRLPQPELPVRLFSEQGAPPFRPRRRRVLIRIAAQMLAASLLFVCVSALLVKLAPFVTDYAETYLAF